MANTLRTATTITETFSKEQGVAELSKSDLRDMERSLEKITHELGGNSFIGAGDRLRDISNLLEKVVSRLDDISRKLDHR